MSYIKQAVGIVILGIVAGLAFNQVRPRFAPPPAAPPVQPAPALPPAATVSGTPVPLPPPPQLAAAAPAEASPSGIDLMSYDPVADTERLKKEYVARQQAEAEKLHIEALSLSQALDLHRNWAAFIDARPPDQFANGHIRDAFNIPETAFDENLRFFRSSAQAPPTQPVVVYCGGEDCAISYRVARKLAENGFTNVKVYKGGWDEWFAACQKDPSTYPIE
ncbi:MAG: hypothetical protein KA419_08630 [Acidobacteria bacterium]|nr:hypothetical protein [Acidobacteriota bacterium]